MLVSRPPVPDTIDTHSLAEYAPADETNIVAPIAATRIVFIGLLRRDSPHGLSLLCNSVAINALLESSAISGRSWALSQMESRPGSYGKKVDLLELGLCIARVPYRCCGPPCFPGGNAECTQYCPVE